MERIARVEISLARDIGHELVVDRTRARNAGAFWRSRHLANAPRFDVLFYFVQNSVEFTTRHIALHLLVPFVIVPAVQPRRKLSPLFERESLDLALDFSQTH